MLFEFKTISKQSKPHTLNSSDKKYEQPVYAPYVFYGAGME